MTYQPRISCRATLAALVTSLAVLVAAEPLIGGQFQTKEPPLPGAQPSPIPSPIPPPPPPPARIIQQPQPYPQPTPVVPPPGLPPTAIPLPAQQPPLGIVEVPCPPVDPPTPLVRLRVRVSECSAEGQEIEYRITVENCSPAPAHHVVVRNPLPDNCRFVRAQPEPVEKEPDLVWTFGTLSPGENRDITLVLAPTDSGDVKNCARVQYEHGQCVVTRIAKSMPGSIPPEKEPAKEKESPKTIPSKATKLDVKITGPKQQYANLPARYQIAVTNTGDSMAENLLVSALLPQNGTFVAASDNGVFHFSQVVWRLGSLAPGSSKTVEVTYRVSAPGDACVTALALADDNVRGEAEHCTHFEGASALHLETMDTKDPVEIGGQTSYRITIFNQGSMDLTNIELKVLVPRELALIRATGATAPPPPEQLQPAGPDGQTLNFAVLTQLKPGEKQTYEVFARAVMPGDARWRAVLTCNELTGGPVAEEESTAVFRPDGAE